MPITEKDPVTITHYYHQPINVPTAGAQAFLMDYTQGIRAITHHAGPVRVGTIIHVEEEC
jgi:hypothetical protein